MAVVRAKEHCDLPALPQPVALKDYGATVVNGALVLPKDAQAELGGYLLAVRNYLTAVQECLNAP